jgi:hypothetical protein
VRRGTSYRAACAARPAAPGHLGGVEEGEVVCSQRCRQIGDLPIFEPPRPRECATDERRCGARRPRGGRRTRRSKIKIIDAERQGPTSTDSEARQEIAVKIHARLRNSALHTDRAVVPGDCLPEEPQEHHHRPGIVHVERREEVRRESVAGLPGFCYLLDQPEHGDRRWLIG